MEGMEGMEGSESGLEFQKGKRLYPPHTLHYLPLPSTMPHSLTGLSHFTEP
jgi:hypothetical protein